MRVEVQAVAPEQVEADVVAVPLVAEDGLGSAAKSLDAGLDGLLSRLTGEGELHDELGRAGIVHVDGKLGAPRVAAAGVGPRDRLDADALRTAAAAVARKAGELAERAREIASSGQNLSADALGPDEIREQGMGALAAVAQGSDNPPRLVVLRYDPPEAKGDLLLGLVGKAITFDTGGISLKPSLHMEDMKGDMAGGAAVLEATGAIADLGLPIRVISVVAASENMPGGGAYRPGDILTAASGKTIEVTNTDAES